MEQNRDYIKRYKQTNTGEVGMQVCFDHAAGSYFYDVENKKYLDFTSGYGVTNTGWLRPDLEEVILRQVRSAAYAPPWLPTREAIGLSELILRLVPDNLCYCARATGGADANEIIQKAAFACTGKSKLLSFRRSYHGGTHFTLNLSDKNEFNLPRTFPEDKYLYIDPPYCFRCPFGKKADCCELECTRQVETIFQKEKDIGVFFAEPVLGSGGVIIPPTKYWQRIRELCTQYEVFLAFDEVLTGFGRTGHLTASEYFHVKPDAISFAKGLTSGYAALGVAVLNKTLGEGLKKFEDVSSTFAWTPLACAVAKANIEFILNNNLGEQSRMKGNLLIKKLRIVFNNQFPEKTGEIRGVGLMIGIEMITDPVSRKPDKNFMKRFVLKALKNGIMICASWDFRTLVLMPPLTISVRELQEGVDLIEKTLMEMKPIDTNKTLSAVS